MFLLGVCNLRPRVPQHLMQAILSACHPGALQTKRATMDDLGHLECLKKPIGCARISTGTWRSVRLNINTKSAWNPHLRFTLSTCRPISGALIVPQPCPSPNQCHALRKHSLIRPFLAHAAPSFLAANAMQPTTGGFQIVNCDTLTLCKGPSAAFTSRTRKPAGKYKTRCTPPPSFQHQHHFQVQSIFEYRVFQFSRRSPFVFIP